jgi:hypothetical protein
MPQSPAEILADFRNGLLTAEEAAKQLLPLLQTSGRLNLELGPETRPVLEALRRIAGIDRRPRPAAEPLVWDSPHWRRLGRVADDFWTILRDRRLDQSPQCLRYAFTVRSSAAATALEDYVLDHSDHEVKVDLPASFQAGTGQVIGTTQPRRLTQTDLQAWVAWLLAVPPVEDAALTDLGISPPTADAG